MSQIEFLLEKALMLQANAQLEEALSVFQTILSIEPEEINSLHFSGLLNFQLGFKQEALQWLKKAINIAPNIADFHSNIAHVLQDVGQLELAFMHCKRALTLDSNLAEAHHHLANILQEKKHYHEAISHYQQALELQCVFPEVHYNLARLYYNQDNQVKALEHFFLTLEQSSEFPQVHEYIAFIFFQRGHFSRAILHFSQVSPADAEIHHHLAIAYQGRGQYVEALYHFQGALAQGYDNQRLLSNYLLCLNWAPEQSKLKIFESFKIWGREFHSVAIKAVQKKKVRIGYLSPDFRRHSATQIFLPLFKYHRREVFEIYAYSNTQHRDEVTSQFQEMAQVWRDISAVEDTRVLELIRDDEIDILVDLSGHTSHHRLPIFAQRAAPLQLSGLGFGSTTGVINMDYRLSDPLVVPPEEVRYNSEKIAFLKSIFLWAPPAYDVLPGNKTESAFVFGSTNSLFKLNASCVKIWREILERCSHSKLLVKAEQFKERETLEWFKQQHLLPIERLILLGESSHQEHLETYNQIDLLLDPFPTQGGITTCESLWMETPVLTLAGGTRTGDSILSQLDLEDLIAQNSQEYLEKACYYYQQREYLGELKLGLRNRLLKSAICDSKGFVSNVEKLYLQLWNMKLNENDL